MPVKDPCSNLPGKALKLHGIPKLAGQTPDLKGAVGRASGALGDFGVEGFRVLGLGFLGFRLQGLEFVGVLGLPWILPQFSNS